MLQVAEAFDANTPEGREKVRSSFERNLQGLIDEAASWGIILDIEPVVPLPVGKRHRVAHARYDASYPDWVQTMRQREHGRVPPFDGSINIKGIP